jgi:2-dehydro-3-deoxyglucarate aldolase
MNAFRQLLRAAGGHPPVGSWIVSASPLVAEALGHAGFDWAVLDMAHSQLDARDVLCALHAISATRMVPVVRVPRGDTAAVERVLDAGACTLLFPSIQNAETARQAVAATRHPPAGQRGMAAISRASRFGTTSPNPGGSHQPIGVIAQLESPHALNLLEEIAAIDGIDALFVSAADLAAGAGHLGQPSHPEVIELLGRAARRAQAVGKPIGTGGTSPEAVAQYRAMGFDFVAIGSDLGLLMHGAQAALGALRTKEVAHVHSLTGGTRAAEGGY